MLQRISDLIIYFIMDSYMFNRFLKIKSRRKAVTAIISRRQGRGNMIID